MPGATSQSSQVDILLQSGHDQECQRSNPLHFHVIDVDTGQAVAGLKPRLRYHRAADDLTIERSNGAEHGDGVYTFPFRPSIRGAHALLFLAEYNGCPITEVFALDVSPTRATADVGGVSYRVSTEWIPGHIHSHPTEPVRLVFEINRSESGSYEPVVAERVQVVVASADRRVTDRLDAIALGPGRYEARRVFSIDEVGPSDVTYEVTLVFRDTATGGELPEGVLTFPLAAGPSH